MCHYHPPRNGRNIKVNLPQVTQLTKQCPLTSVCPLMRPTHLGNSLQSLCLYLHLEMQIQGYVLFNGNGTGEYWRRRPRPPASAPPDIATIFSITPWHYRLTVTSSSVSATAFDFLDTAAKENGAKKALSSSRSSFPPSSVVGNKGKWMFLCVRFLAPLLAHRSFQGHPIPPPTTHYRQSNKKEENEKKKTLIGFDSIENNAGLSAHIFSAAATPSWSPTLPPVLSCSLSNVPLLIPSPTILPVRLLLPLLL